MRAGGAGVVSEELAAAMKRVERGQGLRVVK